MCRQSFWIRVLGVALVVGGMTANAASMFDYPKWAGNVLFEDPLDDNSRGWVLSGSQITTSGPNGESECGPIVPENNTSTEARLTFSTPYDITRKTYAVFIRIRTDNTTGGYGGNGFINLNDAGSAKFWTPHVRPGDRSYVQGREIDNTQTGWQGLSDPDPVETFATTSTYVDFRIDLEPDADAGLLTFSFYRWVDDAWDYRGSVGGAANFFGLGTAQLQDLAFGTRNSSGAVYFDAIAFATVPEPATATLLLLIVGSAASRRFTRKSR